jgi:sugar transferase (PEP-CTERM/EpsH1 system associated)
VNILFLTHRLPFAPNRGDRIRAYYLLREMARFARVSLFSLVHDDEEQARAASMPFAVETRVARVRRSANVPAVAASLASTRPLTHALLRSGETATALRELIARSRPDVIVAFCSGMAPLAMSPPLAGIPFVLDMVDVDSAKWARLAGTAGGPARWIYAREARTLASFERKAMRAARVTLVVNDRERDQLRIDSPDARIEVVPSGIETDAFRPATPAAPTAAVVFTGVMSYAPNVDAVTWFASAIWPEVRRRRPDASFTIVGSSPVREIRALAERDRSIVVTGAVPAVQPYLWESAVSVAPLRLAQGIQNKVLEALAARLPVVVTPAVWDGLPAEARPGCTRADDAAAFASEVVARLDETPEERRARAARACLAPLNWHSCLAPLEGLLAEAVERARPPAVAGR